MLTTRTLKRLTANTELRMTLSKNQKCKQKLLRILQELVLMTLLMLWTPMVMRKLILFLLKTGMEHQITAMSPLLQPLQLFLLKKII